MEFSLLFFGSDVFTFNDNTSILFQNLKKKQLLKILFSLLFLHSFRKLPRIRYRDKNSSVISFAKQFMFSIYFATVL